MDLNHLQKKTTAFVLLVACINLFMGCHRYFKPVEMPAPTVETKQSTIKKLSVQNRYFILRKGIHSYALSNIILDQEKMTMTANLSGVPDVHQLYLDQTKTKHTYSKAKGQFVVLTEVHLFTGDTTAIDSLTSYTFPLADVQKIDVIEFDQQKTNTSYTWGIIGITLGVVLVVLLIAAATYDPYVPTPTPTESSCPYVSTFNGKDYQLQGEIYSGAIYSTLQKEDYLPLQIKPVNGEYRIKISNELEEVQHTDFADLMVVDHDANVQMLIDPVGKLYSISLPQVPVSATLNNKTDMTQEMKYKDNRSCLFNNGTNAKPLEDLYISFKNDSRKKQGKLVLSARTSTWLNYLHNEFSRGFGSYYNKWIEEQEKRPAGEIEKWMAEQNIPLTVSVKTPEGWKEIQQIKPIGPLLNRDIVIPADLPDAETAEFRISGGYMFWELDYAAMDYSANTDFTVTNIKPYEAVNEKGVNVLNELLNADKKYLYQPTVGDSTIIKYRSIAGKEGMAQSIFLHSSGYYKQVRDFKGAPKVRFLKSFEQPGTLSAFSRQKFLEMWNTVATTKN